MIFAVRDRSFLQLLAVSLVLLPACRGLGGKDDFRLPEIPGPPSVAGLGAPCNHPNVKAFRTLTNYDDPGAGTLTIAYEVLSGTDPSTPTIINLPGGPGGTIIGTGRIAGGIPSTFTVVNFDPRGAGCSANPGVTVPDEAFRTRFLARDVIEVIRTLGLTRYIIYGASYGTIHASVIAWMIEQERQLVPPMGVILSATLGRSYSGYGEYFQQHQNEWTRIKTLLPARAVDRLSAPTPPLGFSAEMWGAFIMSGQMYGDVPGSGHFLVQYLRDLSLDDPVKDEQIRVAVQAYLDAIQADANRPRQRTALVMTCHEVMQTGYLQNRRLVAGALALSGPDLCAFNSTWDVYDSKDYNHSVPTVYFQGQYDPAAPEAQGLYHFQNHTRADRVYVRVGEAAHRPVSVGLATLGCADDVWNALGGVSGTLTTALNQCQSWPITTQNLAGVP